MKHVDGSDAEPVPCGSDIYWKFSVKQAVISYLERSVFAW